MPTTLDSPDGEHSLSWLALARAFLLTAVNSEAWLPLTCYMAEALRSSSCIVTVMAVPCLPAGCLLKFPQYYFSFIHIPLSCVRKVFNPSVHIILEIPVFLFFFFSNCYCIHLFSLFSGNDMCVFRADCMAISQCALAWGSRLLLCPMLLGWL